MKIKKLVITLLVILSLQMFGFESKLDYNVTRIENYKISDQKMKTESLEVKKGFEADNKKYKNRVKVIIKNFIENAISKQSFSEDEIFGAQAMKQMMVSMLEKSIEHQKNKIEEIRFFNDEEAQVTQKVKVFGSKESDAKFENEYEVFKLVLKKLQYKDADDMMVQMKKMEKKEAFSKIMNAISEIIEDELKKEENYVEMTITVSMHKVNNTWHVKNLDEQIKMVEAILSNLENSM